MIIKEKINIKVNHRCVKHYNDIGYKCKGGDIIEIYNTDLTKGSNYKVNVKCDFCSYEKKLPFFKYLKNISNGGLYSCSNKCSVEKYEKTCMDKYGVDNVMFVEDIKNKIKATKKERYGDENYNNSIKIINTNIKKYELDNSNEYEITEWEVYKRICRRFFRKVKKKVFESWDGYDFYDGEYIKNNLKLDFHDKNYPTIDHIVSILEGFKNGITPEEINSTKNLVVTKRILNAKKSSTLDNDNLLDNFQTGYKKEHYHTILCDEWKLKNVKGEEIIISNLCKFCRENNLSYSVMQHISYGLVKNHKDWIYVAKLTNRIIGNKKKPH